ncbi:hypothetical protein K438DRAFT_2064048 [Mycena galopus ATCC 62051]|nr:hypothetical protein K438DRAFT_2064048 [Mycena galopus ATCC 62051]
MAILLNDASNNAAKLLPFESVSGLELEELLALRQADSEMQMLPFVHHNPCGEFGGPQGHIRTRTTINDVAVQCWKALRIPQTKKPGQQNLSLFPQMPVDILLEVLGHLHPIDLGHISCVNKAFRSLVQFHGEGLWRSAFLGYPSLPLCPVEISYRRWAKLLFGVRECDECGAPNTAPDYRLGRRLCTACMNSRLYNNVPKYPSAHEVNTLVVKTFRDNGRTSTADSEVGRLWPADAIAIAQEYERLKSADAEMCLRGDAGPGALSAFIEARKIAVQTIEERAEQADAWGDKVHEEEILPFWYRRYRRVTASVRQRLVAEGHDRRDVDSVDLDLTMQYLEDFPRLTSKRWYKARPHILPLVAVALADRLEREHAALVAERVAAVVVATSHVLRTAPPETWAYAPPHSTIEALPQLQALINDPSNTPLPDDDPRLADALLTLPAFVEAWRAEKRALLTSLLPPPASSACDSACGSATFAFTKSDPDLQRLDLATSVFTCLGSWVGAMSVTAGRALIGWAGAGAHLRCRSLRNYWDRRPHFAPEGAEAAAALVRLVGLDPEATTAAQMDALCGGELCTGAGKGKGAAKGTDPDRRFLCVLCPVEVHRRVHGRRAMRWRECVQHTIERTRMGGGDAAHRGVAPAWALLTDAAVEELRRREAPDPVVENTVWTCTLCTAHYEARTTRAGAVEHVRAQHQIRNPIEGKHFMFFAGSERKPRLPALQAQLGVAHVPELRCNHCTTGAKLRTAREIGHHLTDNGGRHNVTVPSEADWTRVKLVLRTTPGAEGAAGDSNSSTYTDTDMDTAST